MAYNSLTVGLDCRGKWQDTYNGTTIGDADTSLGLSIGYEYTSGYDYPLALGFGVAYQTTGFKDKDGKVDFVPLYLTVKSISQFDASYLYLVGKTGYNWQYGDSDYTGKGIEKATLGGGLYYAMGFGIATTSSNLEFLYSVNNGTYQANGITADIKYSRISMIWCINLDPIPQPAL